MVDFNVNTTKIPQGQVTRWFRTKLIDIKQSGQTVVRTSPKFAKGHLYLFFYDPMGKKTLPYYDTFPLVLVLDIQSDGILGLNLHYLPPKWRYSFMSKLMNYASTKEGEINRIRITYDMLQVSKRLREFRPCLKKYVYQQMRSKILPVMPDEYEMVTLLPFQQFKKERAATVWKESVMAAKGMARTSDQTDHIEGESHGG